MYACMYMGFAPEINLFVFVIRISYLEIVREFWAAGVARIHRDANVAHRVEFKFGALKYEVFDVPLHRSDDA